MVHSIKGNQYNEINKHSTGKWFFVHIGTDRTQDSFHK